MDHARVKMMDATREQQIRHISEFVNKADAVLEKFIEALGWTKPEEKLQVTMVACPLNSNHIIPESSLEKHLETCSWIADGYTKEEMERSLPSSHFFYNNSTSVVPVLIDEEKQHKILSNAAGKNPLAEDSKIRRKVPRTMERCMTELSQQERLAIYDYAVDFAKARNKSSSVKVEDLQMNFMEGPDKDETHPKSELELMAEERDYKRRRPTYRAKNVHITKKSYTEILKEVIQNQMQYLVESKEKSDSEDSPSCKHEPNLKTGSKRHSSTLDSPDHSSSKRRSKTSKHKHKRNDRE